jgi:hypothetical protein
MEKMNKLIKNNELHDRLKNIDHEIFIITPKDQKTVQEGKYASEYLSFFSDTFLGGAKQKGIEDGEFVYNKGVEHKFVLLYSNTADTARLKAGFEKINMIGLTMENSKYDTENNCLTVSGFRNREMAMRYFNTLVKDNNVFRPLRNTNYRNFMISDYNHKILLDKKIPDEYLVFFKRYYLDRKE